MTGNHGIITLQFLNQCFCHLNLNLFHNGFNILLVVPDSQTEADVQLKLFA